MSEIRDDTDDFRDDHDTGGVTAGPEPPGGARPIHLHSPARGRRLAPKATPAPGQKAPSAGLAYEQRLLVLDLWRRSGLPAGDFAPLVGLSKYTLYEWKRRFEAEGPAGLADRPRGSPQGSRLPEVTRRTIVMLKQSHPDWGCQRISDTLLRGPALSASADAVARVLHEAGYETEQPGGSGDVGRVEALRGPTTTHGSAATPTKLPTSGRQQPHSHSAPGTSTPGGGPPHSSSYSPSPTQRRKLDHW